MKKTLKTVGFATLLGTGVLGVVKGRDFLITRGYYTPNWLKKQNNLELILNDELKDDEGKYRVPIFSYIDIEPQGWFDKNTYIEEDEVWVNSTAYEHGRYDDKGNYVTTEVTTEDAESIFDSLLKQVNNVREQEFLNTGVYQLGVNFELLVMLKTSIGVYYMSKNNLEDNKVIKFNTIEEEIKTGGDC